MKHRAPRKRRSAGDAAAVFVMVLMLLALLPLFRVQLAATGLWP